MSVRIVLLSNADIDDIRPMNELKIKTSKTKYNEITNEIDEIVSKLVQEEIRLSEGQLKFIQKFGLSGEHKDSGNWKRVNFMIKLIDRLLVSLN